MHNGTQYGSVQSLWCRTGMEVSIASSLRGKPQKSVGLADVCMFHIYANSPLLSTTGFFSLLLVISRWNPVAAFPHRDLLHLLMLSNLV